MQQYLAKQFHPLRDTVVLLLPDGARCVEYHVRGAICWPIDVGHYAEGAALVAGFNVATRQIHVLYEQAFRTVDHLCDERGVIHAVGIVGLLAAAQAAVGCQRYYCLQSPALSDAPEAVLRKHPQVTFRPVFEHLTVPAAEAEAVVLRNMPQVVLPEGLIVGAWRERRARPSSTVLQYPPLNALAALLAGYERHPWRRSERAYGPRTQPEAEW